MYCKSFWGVAIHLQNKYKLEFALGIWSLCMRSCTVSWKIRGKQEQCIMLLSVSLHERSFFFPSVVSVLYTPVTFEWNLLF